MADFNATVDLFVLPRSIARESKKVQVAMSSAMSGGTKQLDHFNNSLGRITGQASEFSKSLDAATARVFAFGAAMAIINGVRQAFSALINTTIEVEARMVEIQAIAGVTAAQFVDFRNAIFQVAKDTGQAFNIVADGASELARLGLKNEENAKRLKAALVLTNISAVDSAKAVKSLTAVLNGFSKAGLTAEQVVNKIVSVDTAFAVSADDIADGMARAASTADDAGVSFDELQAIITAVAQRTGRTGAVIGNAFKSIFPRLTRSKSLDELKELGVEIDASQSGIEKLRALSKGLEEIGDPVVVNKIKEIAGGIRQINIVSSALKDLGDDASIFAQAVKISETATNEAFEKNEKLVNTLRGSLNELVISVTEVGSAFGDIAIKPLIQDFVKISQFLADVFKGNLAEESGLSFAKTFAQVISNFLRGPGVALVTFALVRLFGLVGKFAKQGFTEILKIGGAAEKTRQIQTGIVELLQKDNNLREQIEGNVLSTSDKSKLILATISKQNVELQKSVDLTKKLAVAAQRSGVVAYADGRFKGRRRGYASGFQAEAATEVLHARALGAPSSVKAVRSKGTIGGRRFTMNSHETEIVNFGRNGDSAVIPHYAKGFIPNFALIDDPRFKLLKRYTQRPGKDPLQLNSSSRVAAALRDGPLKVGVTEAEFGKKLKDYIIARNTELKKSGLAPVSISDNTVEKLRFSKAEKEQAFVAKQVAQGKRGRKAARRGIEGEIIRLSVNKIVGEGNMPTILTPTTSGRPTTSLVPGDKKFKNVRLDYAFDAFRANTKSKKVNDLFNQNFKAKPVLDSFFSSTILPIVQGISGFLGGGKRNPTDVRSIDRISKLEKNMNVVLGNVFEAAVATAVRLDAQENKANMGNFDIRTLKKSQAGQAIQAIFGDGSLKAKGLADFKINTEDSNLKSMGNKMLREGGDSGYASKIVSAIDAAIGDNKGKARGYIPNFANPLADAISRERGAGIPVSKIRVGSHSKLVNSGNPMGLGVTNTIHEPRGLRDVFAKGFIPNFAKELPLARQFNGLITPGLASAFKSLQEAMNRNTYLLNREIISSQQFNRLKQDLVGIYQKKVAQERNRLSQFNVDTDIRNIGVAEKPDYKALTKREEKIVAARQFGGRNMDKALSEAREKIIVDTGVKATRNKNKPIGSVESNKKLISSNIKLQKEAVKLASQYAAGSISKKKFNEALNAHVRETLKSANDTKKNAEQIRRTYAAGVKYANALKASTKQQNAGRFSGGFKKAGSAVANNLGFTLGAQFLIPPAFNALNSTFNSSAKRVKELQTELEGLEQELAQVGSDSKRGRQILKEQNILINKRLKPEEESSQAFEKNIRSAELLTSSAVLFAPQILSGLGKVSAGYGNLNKKAGKLLAIQGKSSAGRLAFLKAEAAILSKSTLGKAGFVGIGAAIGLIIGKAIADSIEKNIIKEYDSVIESAAAPDIERIGSAARRGLLKRTFGGEGRDVRSGLKVEDLRQLIRPEGVERAAFDRVQSAELASIRAKSSDELFAANQEFEKALINLAQVTSETARQERDSGIALANSNGFIIAQNVAVAKSLSDFSLRLSAAAEQSDRFSSIISSLGDSDASKTASTLLNVGGDQFSLRSLQGDFSRQFLRGEISELKTLSGKDQQQFANLEKDFVGAFKKGGEVVARDFLREALNVSSSNEDASEAFDKLFKNLAGNINKQEEKRSQIITSLLKQGNELSKAISEGIKENNSRSADFPGKLARLLQGENVTPLDSIRNALKGLSGIKSGDIEAGVNILRDQEVNLSNLSPQAAKLFDDQLKKIFGGIGGGGQTAEEIRNRVANLVSRFSLKPELDAVLDELKQQLDPAIIRRSGLEDSFEKFLTTSNPLIANALVDKILSQIKSIDASRTTLDLSQFTEAIKIKLVDSVTLTKEDALPDFSDLINQKNAVVNSLQKFTESFVSITPEAAQQDAFIKAFSTLGEETQGFSDAMNSLKTELQEAVGGGEGGSLKDLIKDLRQEIADVKRGLTG